MRFLTSLAAAALLCGCNPGVESDPPAATNVPERAEPRLTPAPPDWARDAVIYQINTRQYSEEGSFAAVEADLDRIQSLGVDILWFMPIHPIGKARRKGTLGSPYAVQDFTAVNPEIGTLEDFRSIVQAAHERDMKVIIDWVANHTAWDNALITEHPDWYTRGADGQMQHPPDTDWVDVADLDYDQAGLRAYMNEAMLYWVEEIGIDGFRCDVAGMVPTDFWNDLRPRLDAIKPVFMLAEWQEPELHEQAFDASYAWRWKEIFQDIVKGEADAADMITYYKDYNADWPNGAMRMAYTSNHDQNTWDGTPFEIYGDAYPAAIVLSFVGQGIPLIYNGQEACNDKRLEFFEKDLIRWKEDCPLEALFLDLVALKTEHSALHNGAWGGDLVVIANDNPNKVFTFRREADGQELVAMFNLSDSAQTYRLTETNLSGSYRDAFSGATQTLTVDAEQSLGPWAYRIYVRD